jgi:hypothetical protein
MSRVLSVEERKQKSVIRAVLLVGWIDFYLAVVVKAYLSIFGWRNTGNPCLPVRKRQSMCLMLSGKLVFAGTASPSKACMKMYWSQSFSNVS